MTQVTARGDANRRAVVLAFGTNAGVDTDGVAKVLDALGPNRMVVLVNVMGPFSRIDKDNAKLEAHRRADGATSPSPTGPRPCGPTRSRSSPTGSTRPSRAPTSSPKSVRAALAEVSERNTGTKVALKDLPIP